MAALPKIILLIALGLSGTVAIAAPGGEAGEPTPEALDAAFSAEDAARVAAGFSAETAGEIIVDPLAAMVDLVDLVFRGVVVSQSYEYDAAGTPFTRTIFSISEALKGEQSSGQVTLLQPGGPSSTDSDRVMMVSDAQYFNVGEEELLFMNLDPGSEYETLRATVMSRFRILGERVYNEDGFGVRLEPLGHGAHRLALDQQRSEDERFTRITIGPHSLDKRFVGRDGRPRGGTPGRAADPQPVADALDIETFSEILRR